MNRDWSFYDTSHVVIRPKLLTPEQFQEGYFRAFRESYAKRSMAARLRDTTSCRQCLCP